MVRRGGCGGKNSRLWLSAGRCRCCCWCCSEAQWDLVILIPPVQPTHYTSSSTHRQETGTPHNIRVSPQQAEEHDKAWLYFQLVKLSCRLFSVWAGAGFPKRGRSASSECRERPVHWCSSSAVHLTQPHYPLGAGPSHHFVLTNLTKHIFQIK